MRDDEREVERLRAPLGDMPLDAGMQEPSRANALIRRGAARGYRPAPVDEAIRKKFAAEIAADQGKLLRLREAMEGTNIVTQDHPIQDAPFFSTQINFSSGRQAVVPGVDTIVGILAVIESRTIAIIRSLEVETFDAIADDDLTVTFFVGPSPQVGAIGVRPSAFPDFRRDFKALGMQGQTMSARISNNGAVPHDVLVRANGWKYLLPDVRESARGSMQSRT